jgi:hypothetical protein
MPSIWNDQGSSEHYTPGRTQRTKEYENFANVDMNSVQSDRSNDNDNSIAPWGGSKHENNVPKSYVFANTTIQTALNNNTKKTDHNNSHLHNNSSNTSRHLRKVQSMPKTMKLQPQPPEKGLTAPSPNFRKSTAQGIVDRLDIKDKLKQMNKTPDLVDQQSKMKTLKSLRVQKMKENLNLITKRKEEMQQQMQPLPPPTLPEQMSPSDLKPPHFNFEQEAEELVMKATENKVGMHPLAFYPTHIPKKTKSLLIKKNAKPLEIIQRKKAMIERQFRGRTADMLKSPSNRPSVIENSSIITNEHGNMRKTRSQDELKSIDSPKKPAEPQVRAMNQYKSFNSAHFNNKRKLVMSISLIHNKLIPANNQKFRYKSEAGFDLQTLAASEDPYSMYKHYVDKVLLPQRSDNASPDVRLLKENNSPTRTEHPTMIAAESQVNINASNVSENNNNNNSNMAKSVMGGLVKINKKGFEMKPVTARVPIFFDPMATTGAGVAHSSDFGKGSFYNNFNIFRKMPQTIKKKLSSNIDHIVFGPWETNK